MVRQYIGEPPASWQLEEQKREHDREIQNYKVRLDSTLISLAKQIKARGEDFKYYLREGYWKMITIESTKVVIQEIFSIYYDESTGAITPFNY